VPIGRVFDDRIFLSTLLFTEFQDPTAPLPAHDLIFNAVGDAELGAEALAQAQVLAKRSGAPLLNDPRQVALSGRADNARRMAGIPGLVVPHIADLGRAKLEAPEAFQTLEGLGFRFPFLLRARGFHAGKHFAKLEKPADLKETLRAMPGDTFSAIEFLNAHSADGKIRKYRVMMIGGRFYPLHAAVSTQWKIHYFSADMRDNPGHRAEDQAFLQDMDRVLGPVALAALQ
ncbi:MAG: hypothetical protein ACREKE_07715, partial [bacterium]